MIYTGIGTDQLIRHITLRLAVGGGANKPIFSLFWLELALRDSGLFCDAISQPKNYQGPFEGVVFFGHSNLSGTQCAFYAQ